MVARRYRLREDHDVTRVRKRGRAAAHGALVVRYMKNDLEPAQNRYTVIAGKKCGNAVHRNRLKRLVREALRGMHPSLQPGFDIAVICRGKIEEMPTLYAAQEALSSIFSRAHLWLTAEDRVQPGESISTGWSEKRGDE